MTKQQQKKSTPTNLNHWGIVSEDTQLLGLKPPPSLTTVDTLLSLAVFFSVGWKNLAQPKASMTSTLEGTQSFQRQLYHLQ